MSSVKGCSNGECAAHKNKTLFKASMSYCPQRGGAYRGMQVKEMLYAFGRPL